ncbi:MAG: helix-turn-helix transcriptional regulator [Firmicutes bacterium]|nr:helix-turn-helix transcriptional regulator [Bacillota bacterium]
MSKNYRETLEKQLQNPVFKSEFDALEPEYQIVKAILEARAEKSFTQKDLSVATGITQSDISKLENGNANPSLRTLKKIAAAFNMQLQIRFVTKR